MLLKLPIRLIFASFLISSLLFSQKDKDTSRNFHFEVSFGQNTLFIPYSKQENILLENSIVIPTSTILLFTELRSDKWIRIPIFFNLAMESKQFLIDSSLVQEKASPTFGTGIMSKVFAFPIKKTTILDFEIGALASFIFDTNKKIRFAPILAARTKIIRKENFSMYLGINYSLGVNALGMMYGTGTVF